VSSLRGGSGLDLGTTNENTLVAHDTGVDGSSLADWNLFSVPHEGPGHESRELIRRAGQIHVLGVEGEVGWS